MATRKETPTTPKQTQAERRGASRRRLLDSALELIADRGFAGTTLGEIGEQAGYSRGMVRERFGSRAEFVDELAGDIRERFALVALGTSRRAESGFEALGLGARTYVGALADERSTIARAFYALLAESIALAPEMRPAFSAANSTFRQLVEEWIRNAKEAGDVDADVEPAAAATFVVGALQGLTLQWLVDPEGIDVTELADEFCRLVLRSLRR